MSEIHPRRVIMSLAMIGIVVAALLLVMRAAPAFAQSPPVTPSPPTDVTGDMGDMEIKLSWTAPATESTCVVTRYFIRLEYYDNQGVMITAEQAFTEDTMYVVTGLVANTRYLATVFSFGESCGKYSTVAFMWFTTTASDATTDPVKPDNQPKPSPNRPRRLSVSSLSTSTATFVWEESNSNDGRCSHGHYSLRVRNLSDKTAAPVKVLEQDAATFTVTGLVSGNRYKITVWSYSRECGIHSPGTSKKFTPP